MSRDLTEAGAIDAAWALCLTIIVGRFSWKMLRDSIRDTSTNPLERPIRDQATHRRR